MGLIKNIILILLISVSSLIANVVATITALNGTADIYREDKKLQAYTGFKLKEKDTIKTFQHTKLQMIFEDETIITLGKNADFSIDEYLFEENKKPIARFGFFKGTMRTMTGKIGKIAPDRFKVKTKTATIGIRGTNFTISTLPNGSQKIFCTYGAISVTINANTFIVKEGFKIDITPQGKSRVEKFTPQELKQVEQTTLKTKMEINPKVDVKITDVTEQTKNAIDIQKENKAINDDIKTDTDYTYIPYTPNIPFIQSSNTYIAMLSGFKLYGISDMINESGSINLNSDLVKIEDKTLYIWDSDENIYKTKGIISFDKVSLGAYTETKLLYTDSFNSVYTYDNTNYNYNFTEVITSDNTAEFLVHKIDTEVYDDGNDGKILYKYLGYSGTLPIMTNLENGKILRYNNFEKLYSSYSAGYAPYYEFQNETYMLLNTNTKSINYHYPLSTTIENGAKIFSSNYITIDGAFIGINYSTDKIKINSEGSLYGTNLQGLGFTSQSINDDGIKEKTISTFFKDTAIPLNVQTGLSNNVGFMTNQYGQEQFAFILNIDKGTGTISASTTVADDDPFKNISFSGIVNNLTSYYIDNNTFGVMMNPTSEFSGGTLIVNKGWLLSVDDGHLDDESSWGYWTGEFEGGDPNPATIGIYSTWVAGVKTATEYIPDSGTVTYSGNLIGGDTNGNYILMNDNNLFEATIDFGEDDITAKFEFDLSDETVTSNPNHTQTLTGIDTVNNTGFTAGDSTNNLQGTYFGTGSIKSIGGSFKLDDVTGVFKGYPSQ